MKERLLAGLLVLAFAGSAFSATYVRVGADATWDGLTGWRDNSTGSWADSTVMPGASDSFVLNNGAVDLSVDTDATLGNMYLVNNANNATVSVDTAGKTLRVNGTLNVGSATQSGVGTLNVTAGTFEMGGSSAIYDLVDVNGGTFSIDQGPANITVDGAGLLKLQSGTFESTGTAASDLLIMKNDVEISGGTVDLNGQTYLSGTTTIKGDAATISIHRLNSSVSIPADFVFEMDADGISAIENTSWINLGNASVSVDGSAYTGGTGTFTLFDCVNLASTSTVTSVTGFTGGLSGYITQDQDTDIVTLTVIPEPGTLGLVAAFGCGIVFIRRLKKI